MSLIRRVGAGPERRRDERGAVAVEFALVLPVLLLVVFGTIQFGFVMAQSAALANGARSGARDGVVNIFGGNDCGDVIARAQEAATSIGMSGASVLVTVKRGSTEGGAVDACSGGSGSLPCTSASTSNENLYVTTAFTSPAIVPLLGFGDFDLSRTGAFRCEYR